MENTIKITTAAATRPRSTAGTRGGPRMALAGVGNASRRPADHFGTTGMRIAASQLAVPTPDFVVNQAHPPREVLR